MDELDDGVEADYHQAHLALQLSADGQWQTVETARPLDGGGQKVLPATRVNKLHDLIGAEPRVDRSCRDLKLSPVSERKYGVQRGVECSPYGVRRGVTHQLYMVQDGASLRVGKIVVS